MGFPARHLFLFFLKLHFKFYISVRTARAACAAALQVAQTRAKCRSDECGLEVDFLFPGGRGVLWVVECKASKTVQPAMARPLEFLRRSMDGRVPVRSVVVHQKSKIAAPMRTLAPGIEALDLEAFVDALGRKPAKGRKTARKSEQ